MAVLRERFPDLRLLFVGKGSRLEQAKSLVAELGLREAVQFRGFVPFELLPHSLGLADAALVTLLPGFEGLVVPSKLLGYMARGVPTLYVGPDSDVGRFVEASGGGACVASGSVDAFVAVVERWMAEPATLAVAGERAAEYYAAHLDKAKGLAAYLAAVSRAATSGAGGPPP
jgi:glycosyltransferase involved in cell wall biosynthesis